MELQVLKSGGAHPEILKVSDDVFSVNFNQGLVHQVVTTYMSAARQGTKAQKTRAEVSGGNSKPWNQKGSGRARAGSTRSPLWRKGGVVFAASPRNYEKKLNRKMYRLASKVILSELIRNERLIIVDSFDLAVPKTKEFLKLMSQYGLQRDLLIVTSEISESLFLGVRNLFDVGLCDVEALDPHSLVAYSKVLVTVDALKKIEGRLL
jgi:large subunit ribosomal protein L4